MILTVPAELLVNHIIPFTDVLDLTSLWDALDSHVRGYSNFWSLACYRIIDRDVPTHLTVHLDYIADTPYYDILHFAWYCMLPRVISHFRPEAIRPVCITREKLATLDRLLTDVRSLSIVSPEDRATLDGIPSWQRTAWVYNKLKRTYPNITSWCN